MLCPIRHDRVFRIRFLGEIAHSDVVVLKKRFVSFRKFGESQICFLFALYFATDKQGPSVCSPNDGTCAICLAESPIQGFSWIRGAVEHRRPVDFPVASIDFDDSDLPRVQIWKHDDGASFCRLHAISEILINLTLLLRQRLCPYGRPIKCTYLCIFS